MKADRFLMFVPNPSPPSQKLNWGIYDDLLSYVDCRGFPIVVNIYNKIFGTKDD